MSALSLRQIYIDDKYLVMHNIGSGHFGDIRLARNVDTNLHVAVKLEDNSKTNVKLPLENTIYKMMLKHETNNQWSPHNYLYYGFPHIYGCGQYEEYNYLIMELLGHNLETLFNICNRRFTLKCVAMIGLQLLARLQFVHSCNIVYRDVKPENFVLRKNDPIGGRIIYLVDFGLAKNLSDTTQVTSERVRPDGKTVRKVIGTCRYMSMNAHKGIDQTFRDDLESLGYLMIYFLKGSLPWQGIGATEIKDKYQRIYELKKTTQLTSLCKGLATEFQEFLAYVRLLNPEEQPNYEHLRDLLTDVLGEDRNTCKWNFDWLNKEAFNSIRSSTREIVYSPERTTEKGNEEVFSRKKVVKCACCELC